MITGKTEVMLTLPLEVDLRRFYAKIRTLKNGCEEWTAARDPAGYGRFGYKYKIHQASRFRYLLEYGTNPENHARGEAFSSLTEKDALAIRVLYCAGINRRSLALKYEVSDGTIWNIGTGRTWKFLPNIL